MFFSIIIPVYNRPEEIGRLLESLLDQTYKFFEVIVVEDGSDLTCEKEIAEYSSKLSIRYFYEENQGQGLARNYGMKMAKGDYFVLFDSDCIIPKNYFEILNKSILERQLDAHGGPDAAAKDFSSLQKAINYSMTSVFTTGGIRGKMKDPAKFQARGFNMGMSKAVFEETRGFIDPNQGEDIELSFRIKKAGYRLELVKEAFVYHARRNDFDSFLRQCYSFGKNRINVSRYHPEALQPVHLFPVIFLMGLFIFPIISILYLPLFKLAMGVYGIWFLLIFLHATVISQSVIVGFLSLFTSFGQLTAYGWGILVGSWRKQGPL
ncbi:glycosyltransferase [Pararhodonellum marinum]|uniref:glycosyltransferase n=1 Tax=Pararhodonellum marinum TaxID=2755358 RepID=UPI00188FAA6C|nr:glycosyltransferase [Pararhodonellum marinum]